MLCDKPHMQYYQRFLGVGELDYLGEQGTGQVLPGTGCRLVLTAKHNLLEDEYKDGQRWYSFDEMITKIRKSKVRLHKLQRKHKHNIFFYVAGETIRATHSYQHPTRDIALILLERAPKLLKESSLPMLPYGVPVITHKPIPAFIIGSGYTGPTSLDAPKSKYDDHRKRFGPIKLFRDSGDEVMCIYSRVTEDQNKSTISSSFSHSGDSGGPVVDSHNYLRAVIVASDKNKHNPRRYTMTYKDVQAFLPWIESGYRAFGYKIKPLMGIPANFDENQYVKTNRTLARLLHGRDPKERTHIVLAHYATQFKPIAQKAKTVDPAPQQKVNTRQLTDREAKHYLLSFPDLWKQLILSGAHDYIAWAKNHWVTRIHQERGRMLCFFLTFKDLAKRDKSFSTKLDALEENMKTLAEQKNR